MKKILNKALKLDLLLLTILMTVYIYFYARYPEVTVWIIVYGLTFALLTNRILTILACLYVNTVYIYSVFPYLHGEDSLISLYRMLQVITATIVVVLVADYYTKMTKRQTYKILKDAQKDPLTGVYTRRILTDVFPKLKQEAFDKPLSIIMIDLDDFKKVNDEKGHLFGDKVLAKIGRIILANTRKQDIPLRYGGDEFLLLLPDTDRSGALTVAEKIKETIKSQTPVTCSIGIITCYKNLCTEEIIKEIDKLCYRAKQRGKDSIEIKELKPEFV